MSGGSVVAVADPIERFLDKILVVDGGCWPWGAARDRHGYGRFTLTQPTRSIRAHRFAYEHFIGPIPEGMQIDHLCHNADETCAGGVTCPHRRCVNPAHLDVATSAENTQRGRTGAQWSRKTHCPQGHEYTEANTYVHRGQRHCRECSRERDRRRRQVAA